MLRLAVVGTLAFARADDLAANGGLVSEEDEEPIIVEEEFRGRFCVAP